MSDRFDAGTGARGDLRRGGHFFVAQLGASAVATVGVTETDLFLYSIAMILAMAVTAIAARRIGEQRGEEAALSAVQAVLLAVLVSVPFALAGRFGRRTCCA